MHLRKRRGYGALMQAEDGALVVRCVIDDCDWSELEEPIGLDTERLLYDDWYEHRLVAHRCDKARSDDTD